MALLRSIADTDDLSEVQNHLRVIASHTLDISETRYGCHWFCLSPHRHLTVATVMFHIAQSLAMVFSIIYDNYIAS